MAEHGEKTEKAAIYSYIFLSDRLELGKVFSLPAK
jgi:hypothetical protein